MKQIKKSITKKDLKLQYGKRIRETYYLNTWKCDNRVLSGIMENFIFSLAGGGRMEGC